MNQLDPNILAAIVESETLRILSAFVAEDDLDYNSLDVKTAFLLLRPDGKVWIK